MKKLGAGMIIGFLAGWAVAFASPNADHNGKFWNALSGAAKDGYVTGYADAMRVSVEKLDSLAVESDFFHWKDSRKIIHQLVGELSASELAPDDAVKQLDSLYANQKYSELDLGSALQVLVLRAKDPRTGEGDAASK